MYILVYADDIVLMAKNEPGLHFMLECLNMWCSVTKISVNSEKSKLVHLRNPARQRSHFVFKCRDSHLETMSMYCFLGLCVNEFFDFDATTRYVTQSASRALGLVNSSGIWMLMFLEA